MCDRSHHTSFIRFFSHPYQLQCSIFPAPFPGTITTLFSDIYNLQTNFTAKTVHSYDQHNRECEEQQSFFTHCVHLCHLLPVRHAYCLQKCSYGTAVIKYAYSF